MTDELLHESQASTEPGQNQIADLQSAPEPAPESVSAQPEESTVPAQTQDATPNQSEEPDSQSEPEIEPAESFADALSAFEHEHTHRSETRQLQGTVVSLSADQVFFDIGYKIEGVLPRSAFPDNADGVNPGDSIPVSITGRNEEGYYQLSRHRVAQPRDWSALERAFAEKIPVAGTVTAVIKGGLNVDVGVRAFMPASRSGTRDAADLEALVGQQINCRITKLDVTDEDVVVDRRVVLEEQARAGLESRRSALEPGATVTGTVRTIMPYGAFVEIEPGIDGLLHVSDISRARIAKPDDVLSVGEQLTVRILKIDPETGKIALGLKQLQPEPWETAAERYVPGQRIAGAVTRLTDFGAFVELEPGLEGLIHISEMSWAKKIRHPSDVLREGDRVDAVVLAVKPPAGSEAGRISLGLKQTLADPWLDVERRFPAGSQVEGPVTKIMNFGAFVQIAEGIDGLVHISEIVADRRLNHPREVLHDGQRVKALVLAIDADKRQIKLSMKQLIPTSIDEYIVEHKAGDRVSGRVVELTSSGAIVELGEGIRAMCRSAAAPSAQAAKTAAPSAAPQTSPPASAAGKPDLSQLSSMLKARWKGNAPAPSAAPDPLAEAQIRTFKIVKLIPDSKKIEVELI
ncbi:30S ribosomal protein S1 [Candidatus Sulfotelmatomonas gaucii]|uniref:30S ribosomal protein S1 n=1 Tax=Candidatus Sulfuritelmatomonas gaucii TaxID=2043161 RepID=A0A2N9L423_9BACT|nr:30S ribosomal protein S1 [Candidatus Sulfotelmatomonas gaucii]